MPDNHSTVIHSEANEMNVSASIRPLSKPVEVRMVERNGTIFYAEMRQQDRWLPLSEAQLAFLSSTRASWKEISGRRSCGSSAWMPLEWYLPQHFEYAPDGRLEVPALEADIDPDAGQGLLALLHASASRGVPTVILDTIALNALQSICPSKEAAAPSARMLH